LTNLAWVFEHRSEKKRCPPTPHHPMDNLSWENFIGKPCG
jgi:hypothetical protein